jgi:uncharacterized protein
VYRTEIASGPLAAVIRTLLPRLLDCCLGHYGARLVSLVVFGSVGRGTAGPDSDLDLLVVASDLPDGRVPRVFDFEAVEHALAVDISSARGQGWAVELSPVFKTPEEVRTGSPLFLDLVDDAVMLFDRDDFMRNELDSLRVRLQKLGARRVWRGDAWFWDLKPDYRPGEVFEI